MRAVQVRAFHLLRYTGAFALAAFAVSFLFFAQPAFAGPAISSPDDQTIVVEDAAEMNVISIGKQVIVKRSAKEVFSWGGDVIVEGRVEGDVAALGGSVIQKKDAYIGGAVIVIGGSYKPESKEPLRAEGKETVMFGMFEEEFREMGQNPSQIFAPSMSVSFFAQRVLSALFWFIVTLGFATLAPGAVSRAIVRFQLSTLKVFGLGIAALISITFLVIALLQVLPDQVGAIVGLMSFALLMLAYGFGRIALQVSLGKMVQKHFQAQLGRSEAISVLIGVVLWTTVLSIPYLWTLAVVVLFAAGIGLVLTARSNPSWHSA